MQKPGIVWRNPKTPKRVWRWRVLQRAYGREIYVIQQLVWLDNQREWTNTAALEVIAGGCAPRRAA